MNLIIIFAPLGISVNSIDPLWSFIVLLTMAKPKPVPFFLVVKYGFKIFDDKIKNILNPYFTTKEKGTGLGLAIVNKIINDHNGKLNFTSLNDGAKIQIEFKKK